jgi:chemotaxis signal transduction protein
MAIYSPLRSRRLTATQAEITTRLITFKLGKDTFAVPLDRVQKVTTLDRVYGDPNNTGFSLTTYQGRELVVVDVGHRIFGREQQVLPPSSSKTSGITSALSAEFVKYLLVLQSNLDRLVGLPIESPPSIQSMPMSAFQPLPEIYQSNSNVHCVSAVSIDTPDRPSIFLLDVDRIVGS